MKTSGASQDHGCAFSTPPLCSSALSVLGNAETAKAQHERLCFLAGAWHSPTAGRQAPEPDRGHLRRISRRFVIRVFGLTSSSSGISGRCQWQCEVFQSFEESQLVGSENTDACAESADEPACGPRQATSYPFDLVISSSQDGEEPSQSSSPRYACSCV